MQTATKPTITATQLIMASTNGSISLEPGLKAKLVEYIQRAPTERNVKINPSVAEAITDGLADRAQVTAESLIYGEAEEKYSLDQSLRTTLASVVREQNPDKKTQRER